jgi:hypothetical protein
VKPLSSDPPLKFPSAEVRAEHERALLIALRRDDDALLALQARADEVAAEGVYRFFHQSFKVYRLQAATQQISDALQALLPEVPLNPWFAQIVADGTGRVFANEHNAHWLRETRPIVEAFLVTKHALDMACRHARAYEEPPTVLETGWGTVLYLFTLR